MEQSGEVGAVCSACHAPLPPDGRCLACFLRGGLPEETLIDEVPAVAGTDYGDFEIARRDDGSLWELGRGAMGVTYKAIDRVLHRPVALKVIQLGAGAVKNGPQSEMLRERFLREARAAAALRHANVAGVFHFGASEDAGRCYYAMELVEGETLEARVRRDGPLAADMALEVAFQVAAALVAAANRGLVHRDLKPGNIMLSGGDSPLGLDVKVIDFGLAKAAAVVLGETDLTQGGFVGTPAYASPEQFARQPVDARSDLYSLGVTLWYMLAGKAPFTGRSLEELSRHPARLHLPVEQLAARGVPACVVTLLRCVLAVDPAERPASAKELLDALEACRRQLGAATAPPAKRRRLRAVAALILALVLTGGGWWAYPPATKSARAVVSSAPASGSALSPVPEKSVAVLPFENLSDDKANGYFTDGVQNEILTDLAKVADLKVISRTSVLQYRNPGQRNLPEIAAQLGVAHVVEGGVQRAGNEVRVSVRLIDARTDAPEWAMQYDKPLDDVFAIQSEIARAIADQLQARISPAEHAAMAEVPTRDVLALQLYQEALELDDRISDPNARDSLFQAVSLLGQAIKRDPRFVAAWCLLGEVHLDLYWNDFDHTDARRDLARAAVEEARQLQPDAPETRLALATYDYYGLRDYERALAELALVLRTRPNDAWALACAGAIHRRQGRWEEAIREWERCAELDPRHLDPIQALAETYAALRRYPEADRTYRRALDISHGNVEIREILALLPFCERADLEPFHALNAAILAGEPAAVAGSAYYRLYGALAEHDAAAARTALAALPAGGRQDMNGHNLPRDWFVAITARAFGDRDGARRAFDAARAQVEPLVRAQPDYASAWSALGLIDAGLGRKEDAIREGRRACELLPVSRDAWHGPALIGNLAEIQAWTGDTDVAIEQLAKVLYSPGNTTNGGFFYGGLRGDPRWEPLRGDARFEALVASRASGRIDPVRGSVRQDSGPPVLAAEGLTRPDQTVTPAAPVIPGKSIAVLPFENLSADKENAFFTDGVQNEILADLAKVADLKVIARSSVIQYKSDAPRNLPEIATRLGVANVLEGSVQRAGNQVRVTAKLIDARTSAERWGEHYDRPLDDVFAIQSEIAQAIAGQLQAKLSPREQAALAERPTADIRAYEQYVRGKEILNRYLDLKDQRAELLQAVDLLQDATRRDPGFVEAYCSLGLVHDLLYFLGLDATPARRALAREAVDQALKLRPDSGEVHLALANYYAHCDRDYARVEAELAIARPALPNSARFYFLSAGLNRRLGRWEESTREFEKALELDPHSATARDLLGDTYVLTRRFADAERFFQPTFRTDYDPRFAAAIVASLKFAATGNTKNWRTALRELPGYIDPSGNVTAGRIFVALADGDPAAASAALAASPLPAFQDVDFSFYYPRAWYEAQIARAAGDDARLRTAFAACRKVLEARPETNAEEPRTLAVLAQVDAGLGDKEKALQEGWRAVELMPVSKDAYDGPLVLQGLAQVYVWTGDHARAIDALETLVRLPGYLSYGYLRADPIWSPLRGDPRFEAVVASLAPKPGS